MICPVLGRREELEHGPSVCDGLCGHTCQRYRLTVPCTRPLYLQRYQRPSEVTPDHCVSHIFGRDLLTIDLENFISLFQDLRIVRRAAKHYVVDVNPFEHQPDLENKHARREGCIWSCAEQIRRASRCTCSSVPRQGCELFTAWQRCCERRRRKCHEPLLSSRSGHRSFSSKALRGLPLRPGYL